ncbi:hypothetical protein ACLEJW_18040 [Pseudomonas sp. SMSB3]|uniref:hypothetical protein n=1 Tax=Pseudomonas sp. SMSB3 TaxID=3390196 RepID=UPI003F835A09
MMKIMPTGSTFHLRSPASPSLPTGLPEQEQSRDQSVTLSSQGLEKAKTRSDLLAQHARIYGKDSLASQLRQEYLALGEARFRLISPPEHYGAAEVQRFSKTLDYLVSLQKLTGTETRSDKNPFWEMSRDELAAIELDEEHYSMEERSAAQRAKWQKDTIYFTRLIDYANSTHDLRPLYKGYLEFLDNITPVERLNYPDGERESVAAELFQAEKEHGRLPEALSLWQLIDWPEDGKLNTEHLLQPPAAEPTSAVETGPAEGQGNSRLR